MEWLNYHHLLYFWTVAREGSITRACQRLQLSQPTISAQLRALERSLGTDLFRREGRSLVITDAGQLVFHYADEIFGLGREMVDTLRSRPTGRPLRLTVGIADVVPKWVAYQMLKPAVLGDRPIRLICREGRSDWLLAELAVHRLDLMLTDGPIGSDVNIKAYNHLIGECSVVLLGTRPLVERYSEGFPRSLDGAPFLVPTENTALRRGLEQWFESEGIHPDIRGEFEDSALMKVFGQDGLGIFPNPAVSSAAIQSQLGVSEVGEIGSVKERVYAITVQRKLKHPAIALICDSARRNLFGADAGPDPEVPPDGQAIVADRDGADSEAPDGI
ncbi:MAG: transcriptional activator NhaR [Isosphaeraceae bacterium]